MEKYLFVLDSGSSYPVDLPPDTVVLSIGVTYQAKTYYGDFSRSQIQQLIANGEQLTTTQPIIGETLKLVTKSLQTYDKVIILPISKGLSSHYASLLLLEKEFAGRLIVLDSLAIGIDGNWTIRELQSLIRDQKIDVTKEALNAWLLERQQRVCGVVIVNQPDQLIRGGRLKGVKGLIARHFKLKLVIKFDGRLTYVAKDRHLEGAVMKALDLIDQQIHFRKNGIAHLSVMNETNQVVDIKKFLPGDYQVEPSLLPDCVTCHTGFDTLSILIEAKGKADRS